ncbi:22573_t:CDS:2 [Rhizophagus irregularis]|nr:22573_t:CDS:2 [Rhizophagus irregularis]
MPSTPSEFNGSSCSDISGHFVTKVISATSSTHLTSGLTTTRKRIKREGGSQRERSHPHTRAKDAKSWVKPVKHIVKHIIKKTEGNDQQLIRQKVQQNPERCELGEGILITEERSLKKEAIKIRIDRSDERNIKEESDRGIQRISEIHHPYAPLYYVLMFPRGEDGTYSSPAL